MVTLDLNQLKNGRWEVRLFNEQTKKWRRCPGTSTFSSKSNAAAGKSRHKKKVEDHFIELTKHKLIASYPFGAGVFN